MTYPSLSQARELAHKLLDGQIDVPMGPENDELYWVADALARFVYLTPGLQVDSWSPLHMPDQSNWGETGIAWSTGEAGPSESAS